MFYYVLSIDVIQNTWNLIYSNFEDFASMASLKDYQAKILPIYNLKLI